VRPTRRFVSAMVVTVSAGACATPEPAPAPTPALCETPGIAIDAKLLQNRSLADVRREYADWIPADVPMFAISSTPQVGNGEDVARVLQARYPADLRERGIGGTTVFAVLVDPKGVIREHRLSSRSGESRLDQAARAALGVARFHPARAPNGCAVQYLGTVPLAFKSMR
jgi:periplasmic protein TonB